MGGGWKGEMRGQRVSLCGMSLTRRILKCLPIQAPYAFVCLSEGLVMGDSCVFPEQGMRLSSCLPQGKPLDGRHISKSDFPFLFEGISVNVMFMVTLPQLASLKVGRRQSPLAAILHSLSPPPFIPPLHPHPKQPRGGSGKRNNSKERLCDR